MIIASLVIMLVVIAACIHYTFEAYNLVKDYENLHKLDEETITSYQRLCREINEECVEALQVNDYKNCKEHYKIIKGLVEDV